MLQGMVGRLAATVDREVPALLLARHHSSVTLDGVGIREGGTIRSQLRHDPGSQAFTHSAEGREDRLIRMPLPQFLDLFAVLLKPVVNQLQLPGQQLNLGLFARAQNLRHRPLLHPRTPDLAAVTSRADILIAAAFDCFFLTVQTEKYCQLLTMSS